MDDRSKDSRIQSPESGVEPSSLPRDPGPAPALRAENLTKSYHDGERELKVLRAVNLTVAAGEVVAVLGRSGTGKSTLLHLLGLLDRPASGEVYVAGQATGKLPERQRTRLRGRTIGFVFQHYHLLGEFTALENVAIAGAVGGGEAWAEKTGSAPGNCWAR